MTYNITFREQGSLIRFSGSLNIQDINDANGKLYSSADFDGHTYQIGDFLEADLSQITEEEANQPAATDWASGMFAPVMKVALVVLDNHVVKLCEHYKKKIRELGLVWECELFDSMADAQKWIDS